ncbi:hypothetical protein GCM10023231_35340 [Olivibacter ginsenosidimutans]|uniref:HEPN domain-containing protein n=1 Tax=Olivibacter ginsenosidimutans TaxID=1176537 RepID=A0ABP9C0P1_9SPHI
MEILQSILEKLAEKMPLDSVYEFSYRFQGIAQSRLLVVIDSKCQVSAKTLEPMAELCLAETPKHRFRLIPYGELKTAIQHGALYYVLACRQPHQKLIIGKKPLPSPTRKELESIRTKAQEHYEKAKAKQEDFLEGMEFYRSKGNFSQALFMLHQAAELTFRGMENAVFKRDRPSHSLQDHLKLTSQYLPECSKLFDKEEPYFYRLLKLIDQSYTAVRYQRNFEVDPEELEQLTSKLLPILTWCTQYVQDCMAELDEMIRHAEDEALTEVYAPANAIKSIQVSLPKKLLSHLHAEQTQAFTTICTNLIKRESLQQLLLIGLEANNTNKLLTYLPETSAPQTKNVHCFVLGISMQNGVAKSHSIDHPQLRVTVILTSVTHASRALEKKNRFFIQTLTNGSTLYRDSKTDKLGIPSADWVQTLDKARAAWNYRKYKAETFLNCAQLSLEQRKDTHITLFLISQSMEQLCIGLIYACLGYHADQCNIPFLLQVTKLISPKLADCFTVDGVSVSPSILKSISNSLHAVRYKKEAAPSDTELKTAMACYDRFQTIAKECCENNLITLENMILQSQPIPSEHSDYTADDTSAVIPSNSVAV